MIKSCNIFNYVIVAMAENKNLYGSPSAKGESNYSKIVALVRDFINKVVEEQPEDYIEYAARYFTMLNEKDEFDAKTIPGKAKSRQLSEDALIVRSNIGCGTRRLLERRQSVAAEPFDPNAEDEINFKEPVFHKSSEDWERLSQDIQDVFVFKACTSEQLEKLLHAMFEKRVNAGEVVIKQGDEGDNFYVIDKGTFDVVFEDQGQEKKLGSLVEKGSFGELALMHNCPRSATVFAVTDGVLWCLDRITFKRILVGTAQQKRRKHEDLLESVSLLSILTAYERMALADALETQRFEEGQCIIREGDVAHCMYFIETGTVRIAVKEKNSKDEKTIAFASKDEYFGELALVYDACRAASVYAIEDVTCATLDVCAFERLLGPCIELMKTRMENYNEQRRRLGLNTITKKSVTK